MIGGTALVALALDLLVGGHALAQADRLLTRDIAFHRRWFPDLSRGRPG